MSSDDEVSFGPWKVTDTSSKAFIDKNQIVEVRLSMTDLIVVDQDGRTLGTWPVEQVTLVAHGTTDGQLQLRPHSIWITEPDPSEVSLSEMSSKWTAPAVVRSYKNDARGQGAFAHEVEVFGLHGYTPVAQSADDGHVHVGRLLLTGGLSIFAGKSGIRSDGTITVTFQKRVDAPTGPVPASAAEGRSGQSVALDVLDVLERMGDLRDAGLLSHEEFETKKAELLSRL